MVSYKSYLNYLNYDHGLYCRLVSCVSVASSGRVYISDISKVNILRDQIESHFDDMVDKLNARKKILLDELDKKVEKILSEQEATEKMINEYEYEISRKDFETEFLKSFHERSLKQKTEGLKELIYHRTRDIIYFVWDIDMVRDLDTFGKIEFIEKVNYVNKTTPVMKARKRGRNSGEINACGITVDKKTHNIFVADCFNNRVQVFDSKGRHLYIFGENEPGEMNYPYGIAIYDNRVYVSQYYGKRVTIYTVNGNYIDQFGNSGTTSKTINTPSGLATSLINKDVYVCDWDKGVVFVYTDNLKYKSNFGKGKLSHPQDITVTAERIYVLDQGNPCVHIFNTDHSYSHSIVSRGTGGQVQHSAFFTLDIQDNILISDHDRHTISVFTQDGRLIHEIGKGSDMFYQPVGIVIDDMNRIIIMDRKEETPLKIF